MRAGFGGLVTIMSWVRCFWGSGRRFIFSKVKISFSELGKFFWNVVCGGMIDDVGIVNNV